MWRDSFAVPRYQLESTGPRVWAQSIEDDYLLQVERQAAQMRRKDTSSFVGFDQDVNNAPFHAALHKYDEDDSDDEDAPPSRRVYGKDVDLLRQTPHDSSLPRVDDLFEIKPGSEEEFRTTHNPLAPDSPAIGRKNGSFTKFLKKFTPEKDVESKRDDKDDVGATSDSESTGDRDGETPKPKYTEYQARLKVQEDDEYIFAGDSPIRQSRPMSTKDERESTGGDASSLRTRTRSRVERALKKSLSFVKEAVAKKVVE